MKILLLDTNVSSLPIYNHLRIQGFDVFVGGTKPNDCLALLSNNYINFDYSSLNNIQQIVDEYKIDLVLPGCNDVSYSLACEFENKNNRGLNLLSPQVDKIINNKNAFKFFAHNEKLKVPQLFDKSEINKSILSKVIIKPEDSFSGRGVTVIDNISESEISAAIDFAKINSKSGNFLIEEFVEGKLFSHSAFIQNSEIYKDFIVEEHCLNNPFAVDTSWLIPNSLFKHLDVIRAEIKKIVYKLNLCDGLIHTQFIANDHNIWILEVTRRCPGDLYSLLIEYSTGFSYAANYINAIMGLPFVESDETDINRNILRRTITYKSQSSWISLKPHSDKFSLVEFFPLERTGAQLAPAPNGRAGIVFWETNKSEYLTNFL